MMKLVIQTQIRENYAWNEDGTLGTGADAYWKMKGGNTHIFDVSVEQAQTASFFEQCETAVTQKSDAFEEYVLGSDLVDDIDFELSNHIEEWETPHYYTQVGENSFVGYRITHNDEYGYMRSEIKKQTMSLTVKDGVESNHKTIYELVDGTMCQHKDLAEALKEVA